MKEQLKKHKKHIVASVVGAIVVAALFTAILLTAGGGDVIGRYGNETFRTLYDVCKEQTLASGEFEHFTLEWDEDAQFFREGDLVGVRIALQPFENAGLERAKLSSHAAVDGSFLIYSAEKSRKTLGYHAAMGHFHFDFGMGNAFEWAQDLEKNEKDIVFALDPEPFIAAGVQPEQVEGWAYEKVEMHMDGKKTEKEMFLKAFNLK